MRGGREPPSERAAALPGSLALLELDSGASHFRDTLCALHSGSRTLSLQTLQRGALRFGLRVTGRSEVRGLSFLSPSSSCSSARCQGFVCCPDLSAIVVCGIQQVGGIKHPAGGADASDQ